MSLTPRAVSITQNSALVITKATGTAAVMTDIYVIQVPPTMLLELKPSDFVGAYFKDAGAECAATDDVEVVKRDAMGYGNTPVAQGLYAAFKEFQDVTKKKLINGSYLLRGGEMLAIRVKATTVLVNASCYFQITGTLWS